VKEAAARSVRNNRKLGQQEIGVRVESEGLIVVENGTVKGDLKDGQFLPRKVPEEIRTRPALLTLKALVDKI
jgi:hypothetical protein